VAGPVMAGSMVSIICLAARYVRESFAKEFAEKSFRTFVDRKVVDHMIEHPELARGVAEVREMTVCFTDLQGFTALSERLKRDMVPVINEYFALMEPCIARNEGIINRFMGDGILFSYGAPTEHPGDRDGHAAAAVATALQMQEAMVDFNAKLVKEHGIDPLVVRAGISTGQMVACACGSPNRKEYTYFGDRVNFAARLESGNKYTGTKILIGPETCDFAKKIYLCRPIAKLQVVGKKELVQVYEPLGATDKATDRMKRLVELTVPVLETYSKAEFEQCLVALDTLEREFPDGSQTTFCDLYRRPCKEYLLHPPKVFSGEIRLESK
jgi:adenylate cyclase